MDAQLSGHFPGPFCPCVAQVKRLVVEGFIELLSGGLGLDHRFTHTRLVALCLFYLCPSNRRSPSRHILGIDSGVQSHPKATLMRPSCDPHATLMRPSCDPHATLMRPSSQVQARRLGCAPLDYPCVTVALPLFYRCFIGVSPSFIPCPAPEISWGFRQDHGVCTKAALPFDSAGSTVIQIKSRLPTPVGRIWIQPLGAVVPNPKSEPRNAKPETNSNAQCSKAKNRQQCSGFGHSLLGAWGLFRASSFGFRVSAL